MDATTMILLVTGIALVLLTVFASLGVVVIRANESGLIVRRFGQALPPGRLVALFGEAGYQARMLSPGWHFGYWPWAYRIVRVPLVVVPPGEIGLVVAADGLPMPPERVLGREVPCASFQDGEAFLKAGGERGRQLAILTAGSYRINPALFEVITADNAPDHALEVTDLRVFDVPLDRVGIVTTMDGKPIPTGDMAGPVVKGHECFQRGQKFLDALGTRGLQEEVLLSGSWNLNPWFVRVELVPLTEIPIGHVGVVVSYVGGEHVDLTGAEFTHGDLVEKGRKGVWVEPLLPGKHPLNTRVMKVELVPTTNIVLNWASRTESHHYDERLSSIVVRSRDGFSFSLDVSQIIHIGATRAPRVISRVGSMQNLVDHVLQPTVGNYFRNSAQTVTVLDFLSARSERQKEAFENIEVALAAYDVECIDTLIGDIVPPAELMKTQTDRKIAEELQRTYDMQRESQVRRQALERETAVANLQADVVRSEQAIRIARHTADAAAETARGESTALKLHAEAEGAAARARAEGEADAARARYAAKAEGITSVGAARAEAHRMGQAAIGPQAWSALQLAEVLASHGVKLVPDVAVGSGSGAAEALLGKLLLRQGAQPHGEDEAA